MRGVASAWILAGALGLGSCVPNEPPKVGMPAGTVVPETTALVLWVDGMGADVLDTLAEKGLLPNITRYLIRRGVTVRSAVASLPTLTYPNNVSFNTGVLPGHHGIPGDKWFDRDSLVYQNYSYIKSYLQADYDFANKTVYELLEREFTCTILTPIRRGATEFFDNWAEAGVAWLFGYQDTISHLTTLRLADISALAGRSGRWPRFILAYFSSPDTVNHESGGGQPCQDILVDLDQQVGHISQSLEKAGLLERTYMVLISDHGVVPNPRHTDVARFFRDELGIETISDDFGKFHSFQSRLKHFAPARAVVCVDGERFCAIHLRAGEHWWQRPAPAEIDQFTRLAAPARRPQGEGAPPPPALPKVLAALPATDLVVVHDGKDRLRVLSAGGAGELDRVRRDGRKAYRYRVTEGNDPLGYSSLARAAALLDGNHHEADEWFAATLDTRRPDTVVQLLELNDSPRAGDIMLFARPGWDFGKEHRGGHGGLTREEAIVPWVVAGPGLPAGGQIDGARTVDLLPTLLDLLGFSGAIPQGLDGRSIAGRLRGAPPATPSSRPATRSPDR